MVQLEILVIKVHRVDQLGITSKVVLVKLEYRQVLQDVVLDVTDVLRTHPVLGGGAHKALQGTTQAEHLNITQSTHNLLHLQHQPGRARAALWSGLTVTFG